MMELCSNLRAGCALATSILHLKVHMNLHLDNKSPVNGPKSALEIKTPTTLGSQDIGDEFETHAKITMCLTTVASFSSIDYEHCGCVCDGAELMDQEMQYPAC
jgi:hypothetical protein